MTTTQDELPLPRPGRKSRRRTLPPGSRGPVALRAVLAGAGLAATFVAGAWLSTSMMDAAPPPPAPATLVVAETPAEPLPEPVPEPEMAPAEPTVAEPTVAEPTVAESVAAAVEEPAPVASGPEEILPDPEPALATTQALPLEPIPTSEPAVEAVPEPVSQAEPEPAPEPEPMPETAEVAAVTAPAPAPAAAPAPTPAPASAPAAAVEPGRFTVQVGSFSVAENASRLVRELNRRGYDAYLIDWKDGSGRAWSVVRVGRLARAAEARSLLAALRRDGQSGEIRRLR